MQSGDGIDIFQIESEQTSAPLDTASTVTGTSSWQMAELTKQIQRLTEDVAQLQKDKTTQSACWKRTCSDPAGIIDKEGLEGLVQRLENSDAGQLQEMLLSTLHY